MSFWFSHELFESLTELKKIFLPKEGERSCASHNSHADLKMSNTGADGIPFNFETSQPNSFNGPEHKKRVVHGLEFALRKIREVMILILLIPYWNFFRLIFFFVHKRHGM